MRSFRTRSCTSRVCGRCSTCVTASFTRGMTGSCGCYTRSWVPRSVRSSGMCWWCLLTEAFSCSMTFFRCCLSTLRHARSCSFPFFSMLSSVSSVRTSVTSRVSWTTSFCSGCARCSCWGLSSFLTGFGMRSDGVVAGSSFLSYLPASGSCVVRCPASTTCRASLWKLSLRCTVRCGTHSSCCFSCWSCRRPLSTWSLLSTASTTRCFGYG